MATQPADCEAEATTHKVADIIRELHKAEVNNMKGGGLYVHDELRDERNFWAEEFERLLRLVENMADHHSVDCQKVIGDYREEYIDTYF